MVDPVFHEVESDEPTVEQMRHHFLHVHQMDKVKVAAAIANGVDRTMIFRSTKRGADKLVDQLDQIGVRAGAIHGDLRQAAREKALADFASGKLKVLVATDVAARGLDIESVGLVVNYEVPRTLDTYVHRVGRTGRNESTGHALTLAEQIGRAHV